MKDLVIVKATWVDSSYTITFDGWSSSFSKPLLNIWSVCLTRENFLKDVNRSKREKLAKYIAIDKVGSSNMAQMVMDTVIVCKWSSHLIEKYSHISLIDAMLIVWMLMVNINYLSFKKNINLNFDINSICDFLDQVNFKKLNIAQKYGRSFLRYCKFFFMPKKCQHMFGGNCMDLRHWSSKSLLWNFLKSSDMASTGEWNS
jgi:hypothetical protein